MLIKKITRDPSLVTDGFEQPSGTCSILILMDREARQVFTGQKLYMPSCIHLAVSCCILLDYGLAIMKPWHVVHPGQHAH